MGRPPSFIAQIIKAARANSSEPERPWWRVCSFTSGWHESKQRACVHCLELGCERLREIGLDEQRQPLPRNQRPSCDAKLRNGAACKAKVVPGKRRCRSHGGLSTGPKTPEGRDRIAASQRHRWAAWRANDPPIEN
ncbi:HGGxSTG domain-containing protein [Sulfitobacter litoralis]|uniref:HGGxSTG domain-containing protein n=1 Tax=Sulfitobacter litoralis TaxID=335975 RepID=UPI0024466321|nr:HGGxSTG domain-containing protein [Sulfitobacter litoralis]